MTAAPKVTQVEMEMFYNDSPEFKKYVDRYARKHQIDATMALQHLMVKYVYLDYKKKKEEKVEPAVKQEKIFNEDKAC